MNQNTNKTQNNQINDAKEEPVQDTGEEEKEEIIYKLPDNTEKMQKLITTIKENPGDIDITI
jgi:hypothetical protein